MFATLTARRPSSMSKVYIFINDTTRQDIRGKLSFNSNNEEMDFISLSDMLLKMESFFDKIAFPQATYKSRCFYESRKIKTYGGSFEMQTSNENAGRESKATFIVHVKYRQNASWQGEIKWVDENKTQQFRSVLELIKLMDSALSVESNCVDEVKWD